jgi:hypothetical protein
MMTMGDWGVIMQVSHTSFSAYTCFREKHTTCMIDISNAAATWEMTNRK